MQKLTMFSQIFIFELAHPLHKLHIYNFSFSPLVSLHIRIDNLYMAPNLNLYIWHQVIYITYDSDTCQVIPK